MMVMRASIRDFLCVYERMPSVCAIALNLSAISMIFVSLGICFCLFRGRYHEWCEEAYWIISLSIPARFNISSVKCWWSFMYS